MQKRAVQSYVTGGGGGAVCCATCLPRFLVTWLYPSLFFFIRLALTAGPPGGNLGALYCTKSYVVRQLFRSRDLITIAFATAMITPEASTLPVLVQSVALGCT